MRSLLRVLIALASRFSAGVNRVSEPMLNLKSGFDAAALAKAS